MQHFCLLCVPVGIEEAVVPKKLGDARSVLHRWRPKKMSCSSINNSSSSKDQLEASAIGRRFRTITRTWWAVIWSRAAAASTLRCRGTTATCSTWNWTWRRWRRRRTTSTVRRMLKSPPLQVGFRCYSSMLTRSWSRLTFQFINSFISPFLCRLIQDPRGSEWNDGTDLIVDCWMLTRGS